MQKLLHRNVNDLEPAVEELRKLSHLLTDIVFDANEEYRSLEECHLINGIKTNENVKKVQIDMNPLGSKSVLVQLVTMDSFMRSVCEYIFSAGDLMAVADVCANLVYEHLDKKADWNQQYSIMDNNRFSYSRILLEMMHILGTYDNLRALYFLYKCVDSDSYKSFKDIDSSKYFDKVNELIELCACDKAALTAIKSLAVLTVEGKQ